jgi:ABC-2 type transport system ATP-binding protein
LQEYADRRIRALSLGNRQRVGLAAALQHRPAVIVLDEPTNGLDPAGRDEMLELVRRTGTEFGITVVVASHLLGEIERVCDFLVAIEGGRLLRAAPLASFTGRTGALVVEVEEGADGLAQRLRGVGLRAEVDGRAVLLEAEGDGVYDAVRDAVVDLDLSLNRLEPRRSSLEDLFRDDPSAESAA